MDQNDKSSAVLQEISEEATLADLMGPSAEDELAALKAALQADEGYRRDREEFAETFPDVRLSDIPDSVKESAREEGISLAAAYALYLCKRERVRESARRAAAKAAAETPGLPSGAREERFYSIDEMKSMSPSEVRYRYGALLDSLSRGIEKVY